MPISKQLVVVLSLTLTLSTFVTWSDEGASAATAELQNQQSSQTAPAKANSAPSPQELQQLVAPIALYPDALVAQILAGATYPTQVVEADRWLQQNKNLQSAQLVAAVDKQPWDASIKALTQFPSVLDNMNANLSWTSSLGDAYFNVPNDVMNAIQVLRADAKNAGNLKSTSQQTVTTEGQTIVIQPADPEVVYVPTYSPAVYAAPIPVYPGYSGWDMAAASAISFGVGMAVGDAWNNSWGWRGWGTDWHGGNVVYNHNTYVSHSNTFVNRNTQYSQYRNANINRANINSANINRGDINRNTANLNQFNRSMTDQQFSRQDNQFANRPNASSFNQGSFANRDRQDLSQSRGFSSGDRPSIGSGGFSDFGQGGGARLDSSRGFSSFGGGGFGGGGGFRGGGGGRR